MLVPQFDNTSKLPVDFEKYCVCPAANTKYPSVEPVEVVEVKVLLDIKVLLVVPPIDTYVPPCVALFPIAVRPDILVFAAETVVPEKVPVKVPCQYSEELIEVSVVPSAVPPEVTPNACIVTTGVEPPGLVIANGK